ncbi:hypothetical protein GCM10020221_26510 [Streptomyces thioluteus]|uniref:Uncharacterized protein n=1 Tax=Streptomyces thioluteus TaxID=66431 RepID=A0ABN3WWE9_STRTU
MTGDEQTSEIPVAIPLAWGGPPERYWIDHTEAQRRLGILRTKYEEAGFLKMGQAHVIDFPPPRRSPC